MQAVTLERWLEELVSKSNTTQTQEDFSGSGRIAGNTSESKLFKLHSVRGISRKESSGQVLHWREISRKESSGQVLHWREMTRRASTGHATAGEFTGAEGKAVDATRNIYRING